LLGEHSAWIASLFAGFSADEHQTFHRLLKRIWQNLETGATPKNTPETQT
jgi:hypothetical protein